jgi:hypothetical protein
MSYRTWVLALAAFGMLLGGERMAVADEPSNCRFYVVEQYNWEGKLGFYLDFEGTKLAELPVILGVADGKDWRFLAYRPGFVPDEDYRIRAVIAPDGAGLFVDRKLVAESLGAWKPAPARLQVNTRPSWASAPGDWLAIVRQVSITVARSGKEVAHRDFDFSQVAARPVPLQLFEPGRPDSADLAMQPGDTVTIDVSMRFGNGDLRQWAPFVDRYEQCRYADWPEKVRTDDDLRGDVAREDTALAKTRPSTDYDEYGGYLKAGWSEKATGFFRVTRRNGYWWLITPGGNPCFYTGVCSIPGQTWETTPVTGREFLFEWLPPREAPWSAAWSANQWGINDGTEYVCLHTGNLIRKYGPNDWAQQAQRRSIRRIKAWGFSGGGKWGAPGELVSTPVLSAGATPRIARHPDVFDRDICATFRRELERQISPRRDDPRVLGWSLGNEWDEIITRDEIKTILTKPAEAAAKRAFMDYAIDKLYGGSEQRMATAWKIESAERAVMYAETPNPPVEDIEKLRRFYADRYYDFIYRTVKSIDSHHLYLGFWITFGWWENEEDWRLIARHCDVIGYDRYVREYADANLKRLQTETGKPTLCGEFAFPAWYDGMRGYGRYPCYARDDAESGELYVRWVQGATADPYCVGLIWFQFRDQPLTGRGPGRGLALTLGEHYAFGLITVTDRPKWPLVLRMREANLQAAGWRVKAGTQTR